MHVEFVDHLLTDAELEPVNLLVGQRPLETAVMYPEAQTGPVVALVFETVAELDLLDDRPSDLADKFTKVVFSHKGVVLRPEADVLPADGVLAEGLELGHSTLGELTQESRVLSPEESDVRDLEEEHC